MGTSKYHPLAKILMLSLLEHQTIIPVVETALATLELFVNFYIQTHQHDIDWIKETFKTDSTLRGIEIVYFKGNDSGQNILMEVTSELRSSQFVLYISANNSYPNLNDIPATEQKISSDSNLYKFRESREVVNMSFTCMPRNCTLNFVMILANTTTSIDFTFRDSNNTTLGIQFPELGQVYYEIHMFGIVCNSWSYRLYKQNKLAKSGNQTGFFKLPSGLYVMVISFDEGRFHRTLKCSLAVSKIKVYPLNEIPNIIMFQYEKVVIEVMVRNTAMHEMNIEFIFQPKFRGQMLEYFEAQRFRFDELGRWYTKVEIQPDMPHEDFMDLAVSDVREGLLTYYPMKIVVKEIQMYDHNEVENDTLITPPVAEEGDDITSIVFPPMFDGGHPTLPNGRYFTFLVSGAALTFASSNVPVRFENPK